MGFNGESLYKTHPQFSSMRVLLLILFIPILSAGAQPQLHVPEWIEGGYYDLELEMPFNGSIHVKATLMKDLNALDELSLVSSAGRVNLRMKFPSEPGEYTLKISLTELNLSMLYRIYVAPSPNSLANLSSKLLKFEASYSRVSKLLENASYFDEERKTLYEKFGNLSRLVIERRSPENASLLFINISNSIDELSEKLLKVSGYEAFLWSSLVPLESFLELPPETHEFWAKLFSAMLLLLLILVFLYPLYMSYPELESKLESKDPEINERTEKLIEKAEKEMESLKDSKEYLRLILASVLASIGLMTDNLIAIIASMFLSSLMGDIIAFAILLSLHGSSSRGSLQEREIIKGISLIILTSFFIAWIGRSFVPLQAKSQLLTMASPNLVDLIMATCAGIIGAQSLIYREEIGDLIASALAITLVPPASAVGISIAMMDPAIFSGSLALLLVNFIALMTTGYVLARVYLMIPAFRNINASEFFKLWRVLMGLREGESLREVATSLTRRVSWIALILIISLIFAFLITSASPHISSLHKASINMISPILIAISSIIPFQIPEWTQLAICLILAPLSFIYMLRAAREFRENGGSNSSKRSKVIAGLKVLTLFILSWLSSGYLLGIHILGSIGAILTIIMILISGVTSSRKLWNEKSKIFIYLIVIFTLTVLIANSSRASAELYERAQYSGEFVESSRVIISSYLGVMPDDVRVQAEPHALKAQVKLDPLKLEDLKYVKGIEDVIEESIRELVGRDVRVSIEYVLSPS